MTRAPATALLLGLLGCGGDATVSTTNSPSPISELRVPACTSPALAAVRSAIAEAESDRAAALAAFEAAPTAAAAGALLADAVELDQRVRRDDVMAELQREGCAPPEMARLVMSVDAAHREMLGHLLERLGARWFTIGRFGADADRNAWLLVQHADMDRALQRRYLVVLEELAPLGETSPTNLAYLSDRVAAAERARQRYGTQGACGQDGRWALLPLAGSRADVDARRAAAGLEPLAEYVARFDGRCDAEPSGSVHRP